MEDNKPAEKAEKKELDTSVLERILHRQPETTPVQVEAGNCPNCANHGKEAKLKDFTCSVCGYSIPPYLRS